MTVVTIHKAKTELSKLIARVEAGEVITIARGNKPVARILPLADSHGQSKPERKLRGYGALKHLGPLPDSFFDPLSEDELAAWEGKYSFDP
jgi:prevent-host-death family protein